jgi:CHASE2 domain-containing sensor protein
VTQKDRFPKVFASVFTAVMLVLYMPGLVGLHWNGTFSNLQGLWHDFMFRVNRDSLKPGDPRLILLALDDETGQKYGFPLPRATYAPALDRMKSLGVDTVIFDVMFFEKRDGDAQLAAATKRFGRVVHLFAFTEGDASEKPSLPIAELRKATRFFGSPNVDYLRLADGHIRTFQLFRPDVEDPIRGKAPVTSAAAAALAAYQNKSVDEEIADYGDAERVVNYRNPAKWPLHEVGKDSGLMLESPFRRISMRDLLDVKLSTGQRAALKGSIVVIGSTSLGYYDKFPTAFSDDPGAEFHLVALDNMLHGDAMRAPFRAWTLLLIIGAVLLTYWLQRLPTAYGVGLAGASFVAWVAYAQWMFLHGTIVEFVRRRSPSSAPTSCSSRTARSPRARRRGRSRVSSGSSSRPRSSRTSRRTRRRSSSAARSASSRSSSSTSPTSRTSRKRWTPRS